MAETSPQPTVSEPQQQQQQPSQYWCYHCEKRVSVETLTDINDLICYECKNGFVESIAVSAPPSLPTTPPTDFNSLRPSFSQHFLQVLRLIAQSSRDEEAPPPQPSQHPDSASDPPAPAEGDDFLRIELDGWDNDDDDDEDELEFGNIDGERSEDEIGEEDDRDREDNEGDRRRRRRDILRLRIRDFASHATGGRNRNRILDWSEILMGLEDNSIELRMEMPELDGYIGNPEDYVDAAGYEALLQNLAESDAGARRGAPPAARSAVAALETAEITPEEGGLVCAICRESVPVGATVKKLPCGHGYHGDCIVPWLDSRNSCPVCRFELPTDDPEYEERKKRSTATAAVGPSDSGSNDQ